MVQRKRTTRLKRFICPVSYSSHVGNTELGLKLCFQSPGKPLEENEELVCNESAYVMLHQAHTGAPCLSFDILRDDLGDARETFPLSGYIVAGTQAARTHVNK